MGRRRAEHEDRVRFCVAHPVGDLREDDVRLLLGALTRGPEGELDLKDPRTGARLVAAVIERADNEANTAELVPLGIEGPSTGWAELMGEAVDSAICLARTGPRERLQVPLQPRLQALAPILEARRLKSAFANYTMTTDDASYDETPVPRGMRFDDWSPRYAPDKVYALIKRAFQGIPGLMLLPQDQLRKRLETASPPARLLLDGDRIIGVARLKLLDDDAPTGFVNLIAREPALRGKRLGDLLLGEAKRVLAASGARRFALEVVTTNVAALALYERHGFRVASVEHTYQRRLEE
ncbi:MAG: GNAT family N-acetyltransferase [Myxococcales bacterium]|nr:GNAT family N-acetyltransferase [Myxococcales bacterium]MCB9732517.1 GNAT family N-acetyltransferase [Deltaproteobacteria bacterium]